ncbi:hypothetical protein RFI_19555 [Reticulomyxa filosa]|uniref:Uncharacterized protein n=1 Tax=Reticulomyxa filosa TaxID=46433 RepID=X6MVU5_RETFI|nr:hypothetical protein RFI_19555 [Reticulomyxa filosa]|eukprot:ETO17761.1 hypothetical protein RFI_19555 [Reticulomyxa filosa]
MYTYEGLISRQFHATSTTVRPGLDLLICRETGVENGKEKKNSKKEEEDEDEDEDEKTVIPQQPSDDRVNGKGDNKTLEGSKFTLNFASLRGRNNSKSKSATDFSPQVVMASILAPPRNVVTPPAKDEDDSEDEDEDEKDVDREQSPASLTQTQAEVQTNAQTTSHTPTANTNGPTNATIDSTTTTQHNRSKTHTKHSSESRSKTNTSEKRAHDHLHKDERSIMVILAPETEPPHSHLPKAPSPQPPSSFANTLEVVDEEDDITIVESKSFPL